VKIKREILDAGEKNGVNSVESLLSTKEKSRPVFFCYDPYFFEHFHDPSEFFSNKRKTRRSTITRKKWIPWERSKISSQLRSTKHLLENKKKKKKKNGQK
jgi:hypothetical protein